jgi:hypothetical protein
MAGKLFFHRAISMLPAARPIDDADPQRAKMKPSEQWGPACRQQSEWLVHPFQENHGFGQRENRKCNPG